MSLAKPLLFSAVEARYIQNSLQYPLTLGSTKKGGRGGVMQFISDAIPVCTVHKHSGLVLFQFPLFLSF